MSLPASRSGPSKSTGRRSARKSASWKTAKGNSKRRLEGLERGEEEDKEKGVFEKAKVFKVRPANLQAHKIGEIARTIDFDWESPKEVLEQFNSEVKELNEAFNIEGDASEELLDELGDVYFSLSQFIRHLGYNGEMIAQRGNEKFLKRFIQLEKIARSEVVDVANAGAEKLEKLWARAKLT